MMIYEWFPILILAIGFVLTLFLVVVMAVGVADTAKEERERTSDTL